VPDIALHLGVGSVSAGLIMRRLRYPDIVG